MRIIGNLLWWLLGGLEALIGQDAVIWCVGVPMTNSYERMESLAGHQVLLHEMKDTPFTGHVAAGFGDKKMNWAISREDIAAFMVEQLTNDQFLHKMPIIGTMKH